jgi:ribosomal protein S18 acetylase RimI-like enzyme
MQEFVRAADRDDVEVLIELERNHRATVAAVDRGGAAWLEEHHEAGRSGWYERLVDSTWTCLVSGLDAVVLGYAAMRTVEARSVVDTIHVQDGARELGLGERMLEALLIDSRQRGSKRIDADALPGDRLTKNLYERSGLVARRIVASRDLRA